MSTGPLYLASLLPGLADGVVSCWLFVVMTMTMTMTAIIPDDGVSRLIFNFQFSIWEARDLDDQYSMGLRLILYIFFVYSPSP